MKIVKFSIALCFFAALSVGAIFAQNLDSVEGDRQALVDLYNATGGDNWNNNSGWLNGNPSNSWYGVQVNSDGRVVKLKLNGTGFGEDGVLGGNNLTGSLPESIGNLKRVTYFNVKQNQLTGEIPSSIGNMESVERLLLNGVRSDPPDVNDHHPGKDDGGGTADRSNNFTGSLPASIGQLSNLLQLEIIGKGINDIGLTGDIPSEIGDLTNLIGLHLSYNNLTSLPNSLQNLKDLVHLSVENNNFSGGIPETVKELESLRYFRIGKNGIGGTIPDMSMLTELRLFSSTHNDLVGSIPSALYDGTIPNIFTVSLAWNNLTGTLGEFDAQYMSMFTVDGNDLEGAIPESWGGWSMRRMVNFGLSRNNFTGEFPDMSVARDLRFIFAENNNFTGSIPTLDTSEDRKRLAQLNFAGNNFTSVDAGNLALAVQNGRDNFTRLFIQGNSICQDNLDELITAIDNLENKPNIDFRYHSQSASVCEDNEDGDGDDGNSGDGGDDSDSGSGSEGDGDGDEGNGDDGNSDDGSEDEGNNDDGNGNGGQAVRVFPESPLLHGPDHRAGNTSLTPEITWSAVEGAEYYVLHMSRTSPDGMVLDIVTEDTTYVPTEILGDESRHHWRVKAVKEGEEGEWSDIREFTTSSNEMNTSVASGESPQRTELKRNYPNPFNPTTQIEFALAEPNNVSLKVYNMAGQLVSTLVDGMLHAGYHTATFDASNLASGVYIYRFIYGNKALEPRKMTLMK